MANDNNPILYSDLISPDNSITDLIKQLEQLGSAFSRHIGNIESTAKKAKETLQGVSGATNQGRSTIKAAAAETDKLAKAVRDLEYAQSEQAKSVAYTKQILKEQNDLNKLLAKRGKEEIDLTNIKTASYDQLSAQYSINKMRINSVAQEEYEAEGITEDFIETTRLLYEEMNNLQQATGKYQLGVGRYEEAGKSMITVLREQKYELAQMRLAGEETSPEYQKLAKDTANLQNALTNTNSQIKNMASNTTILDTVMSAASAAGGGFAAYTGAMQLFGVESDNVQEAQRKLQSAIAITTGLTAVATQVQSKSNLMNGIARIQTLALAKAEAYERLIKIQGTNATKTATIAQAAFNAVAAVNPYVLLGIALVTVVAALVAFSSSTSDATKKQIAFNEQQSIYLDYLDAEEKELVRVNEERIADLNRQLTLAKARNASLEETQKIEDEIFQEEVKMYAKRQGNRAKEIEALEENREKMKSLRDELRKYQEMVAKGDTELDLGINPISGERMYADLNELIESVQKKIQNTGREIEVAVNITETEKNVNTNRQAELEKRVQAERQAAKQEEDIIAKSEDVKISLIKNAFVRQREQAKAANNREIKDIQFRLDTETNLSIKSRKALNDQIINLRKSLADQLIEIANNEALALRNIERQTTNLTISLMEEGANKRRAILKNQYENEIQDLEWRLAKELELTPAQREELFKQLSLLRDNYDKENKQLEDQIAQEQLEREANQIQLRLDTVRKGSLEEINLRIALLKKQREIELAANKKLDIDLRQDESDINAKYDAEILRETANLNIERELMAFDMLQALAASEFNLQRHTELEKTNFALEQEYDRWRMILALNKKYGGELTDIQIQTYKNIADGIDKEAKNNVKRAKGKDIFEVFGIKLTDDEKDAVNASVSFAVGALNQILDAKLAAADAAVEAAQKEISAAQKSLDYELEARANGYANNVAQAQKDLDLARKTEEKALKDRQKAQQAQLLMDSVSQATNLITATSLIWSQLGIWGAIPAIAVMWGSFAAAKIKAFQATRQQQNDSYGEGHVELLNGGSHQSGNDIDLGTRPDGRRRRAEGGEFFAVINKRNSRKYRSVFPDVIKSINNGTFEQKYLNAYATDGMALNITQNSPDLRELTDNVREIKMQGQRRFYRTPDGKLVEIYKNLKRIYS